MITITPSEAVTLVRKNLDEQEINASALYVSGSPDTTDNDSLDQIIKKTLPEAINAVHRDADALLLEGVTGTPTGATINETVLTFSFTPAILRLVAFQAVDSSVVLGEWIPEFSAEGRKQLNVYVRGTYDDPALVKVQGAQTFRYYTLKAATATTYASNPASAVSRFIYIPEQTYSANAASYSVATLLRDPAILHLTGMVLSIYGENDKANYFFEKAKSL